LTTFTAAFRSRRVALMLPLGFASGLPNPLIGSTLTAWLASDGVDLGTIGLFAAVSIPYNLKVLWSPLLDRFHLPLLGRRRGWMALTQLALLLAVGAMGFIRPGRSPWLLAGAALLVAFLSASQDVVADAYRADILEPHERASGAAIFVTGYRVAMIVSMAGALILSDFIAWSTVYAVMGLTMSVGLIATLLAPSTPEIEGDPHSIRSAYLEPLKEMVSRQGIFATLTVVCFYKLGDSFAGQLLNPFLMGLHFTRSEIGAIAKGMGLSATIVGALLGGGLVARFGLRRCLLAFGILQSVAHVSYAWLAVVGHDYTWLTLSIGIDNLFNGLGTAAFVALLMSLCDHRFTATQYALLSSISTLVGRVLGMASGFVVEVTGWPGFFLLSIAIVIPALLLIPTIPISENK
jgi:MFS transporter, PAT family, beta-lactamase induction signal transducer AmpG